uniref:Uncharacterized protein n=1 Tax=Tanacetum cinerariifolium TaxID=118510 RepID=A0A6L2NK23_TANCI|nr:hypothetical protein [Tanacetum cinerariifolium]
MLLRPQHVGFGDLPDLKGKPQKDDKGFINSGCSRHMIGNIAYLLDFKEFDGGYLTFGGGAHGGRISDKETKDETSEILKNYIKEIENLVDKKVKIIRCDNETEFKNKVMDDFCKEKGKFDGKSDEGFFDGYSLSSKAFRVYNTRTSKVKENLHIGFLENKPMIEGNDPKWLFDIDSQTQSMNYVPVAVDTISDESACTQRDLNEGTSLGKEETSQGYIVMPIWKDDSYFDTPSKDVEDDTHNEDDEKDNLEVDTGRFELNTVDPSINTASSSDPHSLTDMFKLGASDTLEATHVEFFSDRDAPDVNLGNIPNSYRVSTTSHSRIHKNYPIENVIGEVQSSVQTRRMTKPTSKKGFLSAVYKEKIHVEAMQEELLQFKLQQVWILVDLPYEKKAIGTKWVFKNKKDERVIVIRNKARLVAHGHRQEKEVKSASTLVDLEKPLVKDRDANDVDVHLYRSMIGSLMYLTTSRLDSMFTETTSSSTSENGEIVITATVNGRIKTITEASIRRHLKLKDSDSITTLPNAIIFEQLALMGLTRNELMVLCTKLSKRLEDVQSDLQQIRLTYDVAYTKLILKVKNLEHKVKTSQHRRRERVDFEIQGRTSADTEILLDQEEPTELVEDLVYIRRSEEKRKYKGKDIMKEDKSVQKKSKKQLEKERLGHEESIRLQKHIFKEERQRIARDAEIAKQLQEAIAEADSAHDIDWDDPAVLKYNALQNRSFSIDEVRKNMCMFLKNQGGYKQSHFKGMSYEDIRHIFERVWDQIHAFIHMDSEIKKEVMKKSRFDLQQNQFAEEVSEMKDDNSSKLVRGSRKKTVAKKRIGAKLDEESAKRQKLKDVTKEEATTKYEKKKQELRLSLKIIHNDDCEVNYEPLSKKFPIVSWEYQLLGKMEAKDIEVCKLTRANVSSIYHGNIKAFLRRLDRKDLNGLYSLVQERFQDHPLKGHDLLLWVDLRMICDPDENNELWMNQLDWKLLRWKLYENYGVHILFMDGALMEINMLVKKKYPLIKELLEKC